MRCKEAALTAEAEDERVEAARERLRQAVSEGKRVAVEDDGRRQALLEQKRQTTEELGRTLGALADNPQLHQRKQEHDDEKQRCETETLAARQELAAREAQQEAEGAALEASREASIHTARNLGQIAAYYLQTGAAAEAADFFAQAKGLYPPSAPANKFSFSDTFDPPNFHGVRLGEARVFHIFQPASGGAFSE